ncbi:AAA family ATPase [Shouchella clausii]|uniref:AAA family ATPase n=1 Tax=Shouchella clausii TaxID=79880 RepID=UPI002899AC72|nr:AAA family ATPase [Shouchella clausii]
MSFEVKRARREKQKAVIGLVGPSGSGKTVGALMIALGLMREAYPQANDDELWSKIGVADTEHKRSMLYANVNFNNDEERIGEFLHINFEPPYTTERYQAAVEALKKGGAEVVIIDSLSHNWQGEGGIVDQHSNMEGNSFQNWGKLSSETTKLVKTLTRNNVHIIATLRTKQEYAMEQNANGKMQPVKVGTKPVQKDELEYEFMLNFSIDMDNKARASKDNTLLFKGEEIRLSPAVGRKLYKWLELGVDIRAEEEEERKRLLSEIDMLVSGNEEKRKLLEQIEFKMGKRSVSTFKLEHIKLAYERLTTK